MSAGSFLIVQIDMAKHPREIESTHHTGDGVLLPVSCDGHYQTAAAAQSVADYLAERHPNLRTYVVQIVSMASP